MDDPLLEAWEWPYLGEPGDPHFQPGVFNTVEEGWVVVAHSGLQPEVEYARERFAGANGYYLATGRASGLEPEVELMYGDEDRVKVATAAMRLMRTLKLGGSNLYMRENHPDHGQTQRGSVRIKPYGSKTYWGLNAALTRKQVEYTDRGCIARVTLQWVAHTSKWFPAYSADDPTGVLIGEEAGQPW